MMKIRPFVHNLSPSRVVSWTFLLTAVLVAACGTPLPTASPAPTPAQPGPSPTATVTPSPLPSLTPVLPTPSPTPTPSATPTPTATPSPTPRPAGGLPYFGISIRRITAEFGLVEAQEAGVQAIRHDAVSWAAVEPERTDPPTYHWEALAQLDQELINAQEAGLEVVLLVMDTPPWAQAVPGHLCGAIREDRLDAFAEFLQAAVERYRQPPFGIRYWELFNEPDVDPALVQPDSGFGCWGDEEDEFYGGRTFGRMLQVAYPAIKGADPEAVVVFGGLLLDDAESLPGKFLAGALEGGGGDYFDVLAFHGYTLYDPEFYNWDRLPVTKWVDRGGIVVGKAGFLREVLTRYGYDKPLMLNEAGLAWRRPGEPGADYRLAQADYLVKTYTRGLALGLVNVTWFGWRGPGWFEMAPLNPDLSPRPAYHALAFLIDQLDGAAYVGPAAYDGIEGYTFAREGNEVQVLWSDEGEAHAVNVPAGRFLRAWAVDGQTETPVKDGDEARFTVRRPLYVELQGSP